MTWKEFKDEVDLRLEEMGEGQNIEMSYIDWSGNRKPTLDIDSGLPNERDLAIT